MEIIIIIETYQRQQFPAVLQHSMHNLDLNFSQQSYYTSQDDVEWLIEQLSCLEWDMKDVRVVDENLKIITFIII